MQNCILGVTIVLILEADYHIAELDLTLSRLVCVWRKHPLLARQALHRIRLVEAVT